MLYRWHMLGLSALLVATLAAQGAPGDSDTLKKPEGGEKLEEILRQLKDLKADLKSLETKEELRSQRFTQEINERIERVRDFLGGLEARIKRLESDLETMRNQATTSNRISGYAGSGNGAPMGTVRLRNTFPDQVSIVLNGVAHRLLPGDTELVRVPAGSFTYEVLQIQPPKTVTLAAGETVAVTVYPQ